MSDLGQRFAAGDEDAFNEAVERYSKKVYGLCYRMLRNEEEAKDMAQEVFVRIYSKRRSFKGKSSLYTWVYRIAVNMCFSYLKKHRTPMVPLDEVERTLKARSQDGAEAYAELEGLVARALESLPPKQKAVFIMRFYEKMSFREIADTMGTSVGAAKANHHFAVDRLRHMLGEVDRK